MLNEYKNLILLYIIIMSGYIQSNQMIQLPDANYTISVVDTGKIIFVPQLTTAQKTYTLPPIQPGLHYRFINNTAGGTLGQIAVITTPTPAGGVAPTILYGTLLNGTPAVVRKTGQATMSLLAASVKGDYIDVICDGTIWNVSGISGVVGFA